MPVWGMWVSLLRLQPSPKIKFEDVKRLVTKNDKVVFYEFWAEWCGPCKRMKPELNAFDARYPQNKFTRIDIEKKEGKKFVQQFDIKSIPAIVVVVNDREVTRFTGARTLEALERELIPYIAKTK